MYDDYADVTDRDKKALSQSTFFRAVSIIAAVDSKNGCGLCCLLFVNDAFDTIKDTAAAYKL